MLRDAGFGVVMPSWRARCRRASSALVLALMSAGPAWAGCELTQLEIPVQVVNSRPVAMLTLNGAKAPLLVDSGAFYSMLSASAATQLKLPLFGLPVGLIIQGYTGAIEAKRTVVEKVGLLGPS
jgi:hypothetical protein